MATKTHKNGSKYIGHAFPSNANVTSAFQKLFHTVQDLGSKQFSRNLFSVLSLYLSTNTQKEKMKSQAQYAKRTALECLLES